LNTEQRIAIYNERQIIAASFIESPTMNENKAPSAAAPPLDQDKGKNAAPAPVQPGKPPVQGTPEKKV
jgi:hypothetical protein